MNEKDRNMEYVRSSKTDDLRWVLGVIAWLHKEGKLEEEEVTNLVMSLSDEKDS